MPSVESVSFLAVCDRDGCGGTARWAGVVATTGNGTTYRVTGCDRCVYDYAENLDTVGNETEQACVTSGERLPYWGRMFTRRPA